MNWGDGGIMVITKYMRLIGQSFDSWLPLSFPSCSIVIDDWKGF